MEISVLFDNVDIEIEIVPFLLIPFDIFKPMEENGSSGAGDALAGEERNTSNANTTNISGPSIETTNYSFKLPTFWSNVPEVWFIQVEQIFAINRIVSDMSKYRHVIAVLPQEAMTSVLDLLRDPPEENKYLKLKEALISRHSLSENKRLEELLSSSEMGDHSPSTLFRDMENRLGSSSFVNRDLLRRLWLRKLPESVKVSVTSSNLEDISAILSMADKVWEVTHNQKIYAATSAPPTVTNSASCEGELLEAIKALTSEVASLKLNNTRRRANSRYSGRNRSRSQSWNSSRNNYCWYHSNFGNRASKCVQPCKYNENNQLKNE